MKGLFKLSLAAFGAVALGSAFSEQAAALSLTQSQNQTAAGQTLTYNFSGLAPVSGSNGSITIRNGVDSTFDLSSEPGEFFDLEIDGFAAGRFACTASSGVTLLSSCAGTSNNRQTFNQVFSFSSLLPIDVPDLISDGSLAISVIFSDTVAPNFPLSNPNELLVDLDYTAVPTPAPLFGLIGMGVAALRKRKQQEA